jgi:hypothetical protein
MPLVACPSCGRVLRFDDAHAGARLTCPVCQAGLTAPAAAAPSSLGPAFETPLSSVPTAPSAALLPSAPLRLLAPPQAPGEVGRLGGFRVLKELGRGGMGVVFEAEDERLGRRVALKVMRPEAAAHPQGRARFLREARAAAALTHDHVVPIFQVGEDGGVPFFVMPLLPGENLLARLQRPRALPVAEAVRVAAEMAEGLAAAHGAGLIHRDVKPANVWLTAPEGRVKLLDFGLAWTAEGDVRLTHTGAVLGTPAYMAPEQAGGRVDHRADLFGLGVVLYEMLTGRRPFAGDTVVEVLGSVLRGPPPAPASRNPAVPAALSALVLALLEREPSRRPATARQVAASLRAALSTPPPPPPRTAPAVPPSLPRRQAAAGPKTAPPPALAPAGAGRRWWLPPLGAALLLALVVGVTVFVLPRRPAAPSGERDDRPTGQPDLRDRDVVKPADWDKKPRFVGDGDRVTPQDKAGAPKEVRKKDADPARDKAGDRDLMKRPPPPDPKEDRGGAVKDKGKSVEQPRPPPDTKKDGARPVEPAVSLTEALPGRWEHREGQMGAEAIMTVEFRKDGTFVGLFELKFGDMLVSSYDSAGQYRVVAEDEIETSFTNRLTFQPETHRIRATLQGGQMTLRDLGTGEVKQLRRLP